MRKLLWLLMVAIAFGGSGCQKNTQKNSKHTSFSKKHPQSPLVDQDIEELELIDEMDDAFFSSDQSSASSAHKSTIDDFAWAEVEKADRPQEILFAFDQYTIRKDQGKQIEQASKWARTATRKGNKIVVEGHADAIGKNRIYNMGLSENRARTVAQELVHQGVPKNSIKVVGRGQEMIKIIVDLTPDAQQGNRRVEFYEIRS